MTPFRRVPVVLILWVLGGCLQATPLPPHPQAKKVEPAPPPAAAEQPKSILKQTTQDIGKYDPAAGLEIVEADVEVTNPVTGPLEAYGPMVQQISGISVDYMLALYNAEHGRFPNYDEFMAQIIKKNNVRLPVLPGKLQYQYDEQNHKLVVIRPPEPPTEP
jgi:hypothetical protein